MPPADLPTRDVVCLEQDEWAALGATTPMPLRPAELAALQGINEDLSMDEVAGAYLPLSRLLNLHVAGTRQMWGATDAFLGVPLATVPYVIGIAGSVAVGKSTTARVLRELLARWPDHPSVALVTTDGFLHPNEVLKERGILDRKGFPESYDVRRLVRFLAEVKSGAGEVALPVYDHAVYDIVPGAEQRIARPDILVVEGLNVLQTAGHASHFVSDFFDFSIYVDADEHDIETWYVERFWALVERSRDDAGSFFHRFAGFDRAASDEVARLVWSSTNRPNLVENILPTRVRARLVLEKGPDHRVRRVRLRR